MIPRIRAKVGKGDDDKSGAAHNQERIKQTEEHYKKLLDGRVNEIRHLELELESIKAREDDREILAKKLESCYERIEQLEKALKMHHDWHNEYGEIPPEFVGLNLSLEYTDSDLCEVTTKALGGS